ncbi:hypothetical protein SAMN04488134_11354 [Amphibacillus marinus]|uniref:Uncharacterized protein n=2 Tax=Amphibacillus marinus TaxID=872970 RepID=A0A1H8SNM2_9BACI|nr:hypothetical protein SAMN04488134_11354 [Amphibacillus marinus]
MALLNIVIEVVFSGHMLYVAPFLFLMMLTLFADRLIDLIYDAFDKRKYR